MKYSEMVLIPKDDYDNLVHDNGQENVHINQLMFNEGEKINVRHDAKGTGSVQVHNKKKKANKRDNQPIEQSPPPQPHFVDNNTQNSTQNSSQHDNSTNFVADNRENDQYRPNPVPGSNTNFGDARTRLLNRLHSMQTRRYEDADGFIRDYVDDSQNETNVNQFNWDNFDRRKLGTPSPPPSNRLVPKPQMVNKSVMTSPIKTHNQSIMTSPIKTKNQNIMTSPIKTNNQQSKTSITSTQLGDTIDNNLSPILNRGQQSQTGFSFRASTPQPNTKPAGASFISDSSTNTSVIERPQPSEPSNSNTKNNTKNSTKNSTKNGTKNSTKNSTENSTTNDSTSQVSQSMRNSTQFRNKTFQDIIRATTSPNPPPPKFQSFITKHPHGPKVPRKIPLVPQYKSPIRQRIENSAYFNRRAMKLMQLGQQNIDDRRRKRLNESLQEDYVPPKVNVSTMRRLNESKNTTPAVQGSLGRQLGAALNTITNRVSGTALIPSLTQNKVRPTDSMTGLTSKLWRNRFEQLTKTQLDVKNPEPPSTKKKPPRGKRVFPTSVDIDGLPLSKRLRSKKKND